MYTKFQIQTVIPEDLNLPLKALPKQYIDGKLRIDNICRCTIKYIRLNNRGGYGSIYLAKRLDSSGESQDVCVKIPHVKEYSLCQEALIQWLAVKHLERVGLEGAVPHVYDIFQYAGETRFSMSFIEGFRSINYILTSATPEKTLLQILIQVCVILGFLETTIHLDHRDLKADNLWIHMKPIEYRVKIEDSTWYIRAPFQVVLLDFGFSCLGNESGNAVVSLSDGILPRIDPCPKEGRDLFQLLSSLWSVQELRSIIGAELSKQIEALLAYKSKPYSTLVTSTLNQYWVYLLVSDAEFKHPPLHPISLLRLLSIKYPELCTISE